MGTRRAFLKTAAGAVAGRTLRLEGVAAETARRAVPFQSGELVALYETYTAGPTSIGADLTRMTVKAGANDPLIVATGTDMAIFPGGGRPPKVESTRRGSIMSRSRSAISKRLWLYGRLFDFKLRGKSDTAAFIDLGDQFLALQKGRTQAADDGRHLNS